MPCGSYRWTRYGLYDKDKKETIKKANKDLTFPSIKKAEDGLIKQKAKNLCIYDRKKEECVK